MDEQKDSWTFTSEEPARGDDSRVSPHHEPISWSGSEFIAQHKTGSWYLGLFAFIALVCVVIYLLSKDILSIVFVIIMGILFAIIASKKPRQLQYMIDDQGLNIGSRHYPFNDFKSFSIMRDGAIGYISLQPLQRLRPELTIYYAPEDEARVFETLSTYLPHEERAERAVDKLARNIRF